MSRDGLRIRGAVVCLLCATPAFAGDESARPTRVYTNEDLARVSPHRGETGVLSEPAPPDRDAPPPKAGEARDTRAGDAGREEHWRREAARLRERLEPFREEANDLREQVAARRREPGVRPVTDPKLRALERRLAVVEGRIRDAEDRLEERARRARAMPGWLR
jgi:hypothetical protein